jgi:hypothetical protein
MGCFRWNVKQNKPSGNLQYFLKGRHNLNTIIVIMDIINAMKLIAN